MKKHCLGHSTERGVSKNFPEYQKFLTGKVEFRKSIVNTNPIQTVDIIQEIKEGGLGDLIETYVNLIREEKTFNSFWGRVKTYLIGCGKRSSIDRQYLINDLKKALNALKINW